MLTKAIVCRKLYEIWWEDVQLGFACSLRKAGVDIAARHFISEFNSGKANFLCDHTLNAALSVAGDRAINAVKLTEYQAVRTALSGQLGVNHSLLAARVLSLLTQGSLNIKELCKWATRISGDAPHDALLENHTHLWTVGLWNSLHALVDAKPDVEVKINIALSAFASDDEEGLRRVTAVCDFYDEIATNLYSNSEMPAALIRLCKDMLNSLMCWPLLTINDSVAISVPVFASLAGLNIDHPNYSQSTNRVFQKYLDKVFEPKSQRNDDRNGFSNSQLCWDTAFHFSMVKGLSTAKHLWLSQNRRVDNQQVMEKFANCSLEVDFTAAGKMVEKWMHEPFELQGRSAEAYWCQVALGLLLPARRPPLGVCTGTIEDPKGKHEYLIGDVEGLEHKLLYASQVGTLDKMVLPNTAKTKTAVSSAFMGDQNSAVRTDILETCLCFTLRDAADVLQASGWRRARFVSSPEARRQFTSLSHVLFELNDASISLASPPPLDHPLRQVWHQAEALLPLASSVNLSSDKSAVLFAPTARVSEANLGLWLSYADHRVRTGNFAEEVSGKPGLGLLCIKTSESESDMRFWAHVFEELNASKAIWDEFQFGTLEQSAAALIKLFNNFSADPAISRQSAPDLFVIIDEAGSTQTWDKRIRFAGDYRGSLRYLLNTGEILRANRAHIVADGLRHRDEGREYIFGKTRILVLYAESAPRTPEVAQSPDGRGVSNELAVLSVFRSGFSVHAARMVLNEASDFQQVPRKSWLEVHGLLTNLVTSGALTKARGEYCMRSRRQIDGGLIYSAATHEAAGLSFAPTIATTHTVTSNRRMELSAQAIREAKWHFQQMFALASSEDERSAARKYIALIAFLSPREDWDTAQAFTYDKTTFGVEAQQLGTFLYNKEALQTDIPPHFSRGGMTLNFYTNSLNSTLTYQQIGALADEAMAFYEHCMQLGAKGLGAAAAHVLFKSERAFFLIKIMQRCQNKKIKVDPAKWKEWVVERAMLYEHLCRVVEEIWHTPALHTDRSVYPIQHGWLEQHWQLPRYGISFAFAACATDMGPSPQSWLRLAAQLPRAPAPRERLAEEDFFKRKKILLQVAHLWANRVDNPRDFEPRVSAALQRSKDNSTLKKDQISARINLLTWTERNLIRDEPSEWLIEMLACLAGRGPVH